MPYIEDPEFGQITIQTNNKAKRIIARKKDDKIHLTVPLYSSEKEIRKALDEMRPKLTKLKSVSKKIIDEQFSISTLTFEVRISRNDLSKLYLQLKDELLQISVPNSVDIYQEAIQEQLRNMIERGLRHEAKRILPEIVKKLAHLHGFQFTEVKINKSKTRWGSCNAKKSINLSYFCMLLPYHLVELIVLHELCHTREMNHSERFWAQLDSVTDNKSKALTSELKRFSTNL